MGNWKVGENPHELRHDEFGDLVHGGKWYCIQCGVWHRRSHGHYMNPLNHKVTYGEKPILRKPKEAIVK